jgi:autotransporter-associated beta strand protein
MRRVVKCFVLVGGLSTPAWAQTTINGNVMALQSSGAANGNAWALSSDGYVGTYINVTSPTAVSFTLDASGTASNGLNPDMTISIADSTQSFNVTSSSLTNYTYTTPTLAVGTYLVRTQLDNQTATQSPGLTIGSMTVSGTGVSVSNTNSNNNALASASTYISNYRQGQGTITLTNANGIHLGAGTQVQVKLVSNAFNFVGAVYGNSPFSGDTQWINANFNTGQNLAPNTTEEMNYQNAIKQNFNAIVPANAGKWVNNEFTQNSVDMNLVDAMDQFASQSGLRMRMHNLFWNTEQPSWVTSLFPAVGGTITPANLTKLEAAMTSRVNYYLSGSNANTLKAPRTDMYSEVDVFNELWHSQASQDNYLGALGIQGVANYYAQAAADVSAAGANTRLYTNEYNVLPFSPQSISSTGVASGSDPYANWYLNGIQSIQRDGGPISGIGMELYVNGTTGVSAATMEQALGNMSVAKNPNGNPMPLSLTEFGIATGQTPTQAAYDTDLQTALTMMYGSPQATTFGYWGGIGGPNDSSNAISALYNSSYQLTSAGQTWENWMNQYNTNDTLTTNAAGQISFDGTYGEYDVIVNGQTYLLNLVKGTSTYGMMTPIGSSTWTGAGSTGNWSNSGNWTSALAANAPVVFAGTANVITNNDSAANTEYAGMTFNSGAGPFVINGNVINLAGNIVNNSTSVQTINTPLVLQANTTVNAASGNVVLGGSISGSFSLSTAGSNTVTLNAANSYTGGTTVSGVALIVGASGALGNGPVTITNGLLQLGASTGLAQITSLSISGSGVFDVNNNHVIINYGSGPDPIGSIAALLASGYNGGAWNGPGIDSSAAAANSGSYGLGYADSADPGNPAGLASGTIEIAYALLGDANLSGVVDGTDFGIVAANFNKGVTGWDEGDFNYDGVVDGRDFGDLAANFNKGAAGADAVAALYAFAEANGLLAYVPEPASATMTVIAAAGILARRRRAER